jgi:YidC/Oxa1 family membrane protein insertase
MVMGLALAGLVGVRPAAAQPASGKTEPAKADAAKPAAKADAAKPATAKAEPGKPATDAGKPADGGRPAEAKTEGPPAPPATPVDAKIESTVLEEPGHYRAQLTTQAASPEQFVLLHPQYKEDNPRKSNKLAEPIDLVRTSPPLLPVVVSFPNDNNKVASFSLEERATWTLQPRQGTDSPVVFTYETKNVRVTKRFTRTPGTYELTLDVTVENLGDKPESYFLRIATYGWQDPAKQTSSMFSRRNPQTEGVCFTNDKIQKGTLEELLKKGGIGGAGESKWFAVGEHYFVMAAAPRESAADDLCQITAAPDGNIGASITRRQVPIAAHTKAEYRWTLFFGPKLLKELDAVRVDGKDPRLGRVLDYGYGGMAEIFARPMLAILKAVHAVVPSWGFAIIALTILVKAITWWPTTRSMKSMKAMASLKPEVDKLKTRFGDDKNALNLATMELYKKHNVNPLGGCLPVLVQMPIYIGLYAMLGASVELYRSTFFWIKDLTAPDPYFILPILTGGLMFLQQKTQPATGDAQQKQMMYVMSIGFTALNIFWPSGLTIYILTNTILTFVQQLWMKRNDQAPTAGKPARA